MRLLYLLGILLLNSCAVKGLGPRNMENYYQSSGTEKYFLSEIPDWINLSEVANCKRKKPVRFFNLKQLMNSFDIDFKKAIQIQATYNQDFQLFSRNLGGAQVPLSDEQSLFYKASDKVNSNIYFFEPPKHNKVSLVWIDSIINNSEEEKKLKAFLNSEVFNQAVPVLVSVCMTKMEVEEKFKEANYKIISAELLSLYSVDGELNNQFKFNFDFLFTKDHILNFYSKDKVVAEKISTGKIKVLNY